MTLQVNDIVVHATGVAKVVSVEQMYGKQVCKLRLLGVDIIRIGVIVYVPEDKIDDLLRPIMSKEFAQSVLNDIEQHTERECKKHNLKSANTLICEITTDLTCNKLVETFLSYYRKRRSIFEDQFFMQISQRLLPELACALGKSLEDMTKCVQCHIRRYEI